MRLARANEYELIVMNVEYDGLIREAVIIAISVCMCAKQSDKLVQTHTTISLCIYKRSMASTWTSNTQNITGTNARIVHRKLFGKLA